MAQQIAVDGALLDGQAETRGENIFKLHPEEFGVQTFVWHWFRSWNRSGSAEALDSPGICHPESLRFWQGEGSAFHPSVAIFPGSQRSQEKPKNRKVEKCKSR